MALKIPEKIPEKGFYYSYKYNPDDPINKNAFYVFILGFPTTDKNAPPQVVYLPLDPEAPVYKANKSADLKEIDDWFETKEKDGQMIPRFNKIIDEEIIRKLTEIRIQMYGL